MEDPRRPYGYIRRSARPDLARPGTVSHEQQEAAIRRMVAENGEDPDALVLLEDWGVSGRSSAEHRRTAFAELEQAVKDGRVTAVYSWSMNRLARSLSTLTRLAEVCREAETPIRCADGYSPDVSTPTGVLILNILSSIHQWQADWSAERAREGIALRGRSGRYQGPPPYGWNVVDGKLVRDPEVDLDIVIDTYRAIGSYQGTARRLNELGVPTKRGRPWGATVVRSIIRRDAGGLVLSGVGKGRSSAGSFRLSGLLRCPCGGLLTGRTFRGGRWPAYTCKRAATVPGHRRPATISERSVMPAVLKFMRGVQPSPQALARAAALEDNLERRRANILESFFDGVIDKETRTEKLAEVAVRIDRARRRQTALEYEQPADLDSASPSEVNHWLRKYIEYISLSDDYRGIQVMVDMPDRARARVGSIRGSAPGEAPGNGVVV